MSEIPALLPYPKILPLDEVPELDGRLVYVIEGYALDGVAILLFFHEGNMGAKFGDFDGNPINPGDIDFIDASLFVEKLSELMVRARIRQAIFYVSESGVLVDIRISLNVMTGPGMLKDLCGKILPTQKIIDIKPLDEELKETIEKEDYIILKHSSFKVITRGDEMVPLYATKR
jgi:hypothetical protein